MIDSCIWCFPKYILYYPLFTSAVWKRRKHLIHLWTTKKLFTPVYKKSNARCLLFYIRPRYTSSMYIGMSARCVSLFPPGFTHNWFLWCARARHLRKGWCFFVWLYFWLSLPQFISDCLYKHRAWIWYIFLSLRIKRKYLFENNWSDSKEKLKVLGIITRNRGDVTNNTCLIVPFHVVHLQPFDYTSHARWIYNGGQE